MKKAVFQQKAPSGLRSGLFAQDSWPLRLQNEDVYKRQRGYYVDTVGRNKKVIEEYIKNQLQENIAADQITLKEYIDPFTGSKNTKA